jgi:hypothetical protein
MCWTVQKTLENKTREGTHIKFYKIIAAGPRSSVVGGGTMLQAARSLFRFPMRSLDFSF